VANIGYARVSRTDQHPEAQRERLIKDGDVDPSLIFTDHGVSGAQASRPQWEARLASLRKGDKLVVVRLDRVGRSVKNLIEVVDELKKRGVDLKVLDQAIANGGPR
jgi:DNA invertase Pin-like site-specific DNA recombinase